MSENKKLQWEDSYSVGVNEIDKQHRVIIEVINELITEISAKPSEENIVGIIHKLLNYKDYHFKTEEKYFDMYNFEGADEHKKEHIKFGEKIAEMEKEYKEDVIKLAFELVDFLEDWLINHLINKDQEYVECFKRAGLK